MVESKKQTNKWKNKVIIDTKENTVTAERIQS